MGKFKLQFDKRILIHQNENQLFGYYYLLVSLALGTKLPPTKLAFRNRFFLFSPITVLNAMDLTKRKGRLA